MGLRVALEMLAVLLVLTPLLSDGLSMPKCELVEKLESALPQDVADREDLVADLTCRAEIAAQFETRRINQVSAKDLAKGRKTRAAPQTTNSSIPTKPVARSGLGTLAKTTSDAPPKTTTNPPPKTTTYPHLDAYNNSLAKSNLNPPPKTTTNPPPKTTTYPHLDAYNNPLVKSNRNPSPKTDTNLPPKTTTNPRPKSGINLPPDSYPKLPPKSKTTPTSKTGDSRALISKLLDNPQEPVITQADKEIYPTTNYPPMQGAPPPPPPPPPNFNSTYMRPRTRRGLSGSTLYGMFQLDDRVACSSSPKKSSFNLCKLTCDMLIDDDITDDIKCVLTILESRKSNPQIKDEVNRIIRQVSRVLRDTCPEMDSAKYLAECQNP